MCPAGAGAGVPHGGKQHAPWLRLRPSAPRFRVSPADQDADLGCARGTVAGGKSCAGSGSGTWPLATIYSDVPSGGASLFLHPDTCFFLGTGDDCVHTSPRDSANICSHLNFSLLERPPPQNLSSSGEAKLRPGDPVPGNGADSANLPPYWFPGPA